MDIVVVVVEVGYVVFVCVWCEVEGVVVVVVV